MKISAKEKGERPARFGLVRSQPNHLIRSKVEMLKLSTLNFFDKKRRSFKEKGA
jgi:hypothetical protein